MKPGQEFSDPFPPWVFRLTIIFAVFLSLIEIVLFFLWIRALTPENAPSPTYLIRALALLVIPFLPMLVVVGTGIIQQWSKFKWTSKLLMIDVVLCGMSFGLSAINPLYNPIWLTIFELATFMPVFIALIWLVMKSVIDMVKKDFG